MIPALLPFTGQHRVIFSLISPKFAAAAATLTAA
jgi:hypothetical protein